MGNYGKISCRESWHQGSSFDNLWVIGSSCLTKLVRRMANRMAGKIAAVTAAGHGIGRATASMFALEGAKVFASDIDESALSSIPDVSACRLDVTNREAIQRSGGRDRNNRRTFQLCWISPWRDDPSVFRGGTGVSLLISTFVPCIISSVRFCPQCLHREPGQSLTCRLWLRV